MAMQKDRGKGALRDAALRARALVTAEHWLDEDGERTRVFLDGVARLGPQRVALYASRPGEPSTLGIVTALQTAGIQILLPVLRRQPDWADFTAWGEMTPSWGGILEPTGPRLGAAALAQADLIVVTCLAIGRDGTRLGTGGGWYDRALAHRRPDAPIVALSRAAEVLDTVPVLPHDVAVSAIATELGWVDL